ncbi:hypothetical protein SRB5_45830 [Streptomyces sp. RB5]|uniref:Methylamine utilisation protein MauE domain-containing protein n=1 Tax=Streptomyces smaragdinus TaxID=2585196 RepID=A0A7K0CLQ4_9ACTN|nr:MauE/DoxX family redox-associated membrane protein [Streptomyces smaragdinus]MQY14416.1 hypothetical protein [Streptomyces smaragdinus]
MTAFYGALCALTTALTLLAGAAAHLTRPTALPHALRTHRVLPPKAVRPLSLTVPLTEAALGVAAVTGSRIALAAAAALFAAYAAYSRRVLTHGAGGPCGCSRTEVPMSVWVTRRAVALTAVAAAGAALGPGTPSGARLATLLLAAPACAALLWSLPAAMHQPAPVTAEGRPWTSPPVR